MFGNRHIKISRIGYITLFTALGLVAVFVMVSVLPITGAYKLLVVQSGSMEPAVKLGSVVVVKPAAGYRIGDIITFNGGFRDQRGRPLPVTHRIVEMRVDAGTPVYLTKGDANDDADTREVKQKDVIGRMLYAIPYAGYAVEAARTPYGFLVLIIVPALIVMFDQGKKIIAELKRVRHAKAEAASPNHVE